MTVTGNETAAERCASYALGHHPHAIQVRLARDEPARLGTAAVEGDGWVTIHFDDGTAVRRWSHNSVRLRRVVAIADGGVRLGAHGVLTDPTGFGLLVSLAEEPSACVGPGPEDGVDLMDELERRGGFLVRVGPEAAAVGDR